MPATGLMRDRFRFERRAADSTDAGGIDRPGDWDAANAVTCAAQVAYLRGSEAVQDARLQGDQPVVLTIRVSRAARAIDNAWRAVDTRDPTRVFDVTSIAPNRDLAFLDVLAVQKRGQVNG